MYKIEVLEPRAVVLGERVLFPGENQVSEELAADIARCRGYQKTIVSLALGKSPVLRVFDFDGARCKTVEEIELVLEAAAPSPRKAAS